MNLRTLLLGALRDVRSLRTYGLSDWDRLIQAAGETGTLSQLAIGIRREGLDSKVPPPVRPHLESACRLAERHKVALEWELSRIERALSMLDVDVVLLKGAAYHAIDLPTAAGRLTSDVDILVPRNRIAEVEGALRAAGWETGALDSRDQAYFHQWMHELPPLVHHRRGSVLDVHHTILPPTDRLRLDVALLLAASVPVAGRRVHVLAPADMFLHSAAHLFRNGRWTQAVRDFLDMDTMVRRFGSADLFWDRLERRAVELDLWLPCSAALRALHRHFATPVPSALLVRVGASGVLWPLSAVLDRMADSALLPRSLELPDRPCQRARTVLEYWPLPRFEAMRTSLFWTKRLPARQRQAVREDLPLDRADAWPAPPGEDV